MEAGEEIDSLLFTQYIRSVGPFPWHWCRFSVCAIGGDGQLFNGLSQCLNFWSFSMPTSKEPLCRKNPDFYSIECMDLPQHTEEYINDPSCTSNSDPEFTSLPSGSGSFCRALFKMSPWWNYISLASFIYPHCVVQSWASLVAQQ